MLTKEKKLKLILKPSRPRLPAFLRPVMLMWVFINRLLLLAAKAPKRRWPPTNTCPVRKIPRSRNFKHMAVFEKQQRVDSVRGIIKARWFAIVIIVTLGLILKLRCFGWSPVFKPFLLLF